VIRLREAHPDLEFHFLIDSQAQLASIASLAASQKMSRKLTALVELACREAAPAAGHTRKRSP